MKSHPAMCLLLCSAFTQAHETPAFDVHDWPVWAQAQWGHVNPHLPQTLSVTVINRSPLETDNAQLIEAGSLDDVESAGVPTRAFELWFNHQLRDMGIFELSAPQQARFQFELIIMEYQPVYTANGSAGFWRDTKTTFVRWYQDWQEPGLATRLSLSARLTDTHTGATTSYSTFIQAPRCQRINVAASFPPALQSPFFEHWSRSLIGQTSIASMNRLMHWLMQSPPDLEQHIRVSKVLGSRIELQAKDTSFKLGEELLIHHKVDHRELGKAKVVRQRGDTFVAYPFTMHPAAVTEGDYVRVFNQAPELLRFPAAMTQHDQCLRPNMESTFALNQANDQHENVKTPEIIEPAESANADHNAIERSEESPQGTTSLPQSATPIAEQTQNTNDAESSTIQQLDPRD